MIPNKLIKKKNNDGNTIDQRTTSHDQNIPGTKCPIITLVIGHKMSVKSTFFDGHETS